MEEKTLCEYTDDGEKRIAKNLAAHLAEGWEAVTPIYRGFPTVVGQDGLTLRPYMCKIIRYDSEHERARHLRQIAERHGGSDDTAR